MRLSSTAQRSASEILTHSTNSFDFNRRRPTWTRPHFSSSSFSLCLFSAAAGMDVDAGSKMELDQSCKGQPRGRQARTTFGPKALSRFHQILEEVTVDLVGDGVSPEQMRSVEMRTRLAQRLLGFAGSWWTDTQIKQLLLRVLRNEISASRRLCDSGAEARADGN